MTTKFNILLHGNAVEVLDTLNNDEHTSVEELKAALVNAFKHINTIEGELQRNKKQTNNAFINAWLDEDTHIAGLNSYQVKQTKVLCEKFFMAGKASGK